MGQHQIVPALDDGSALLGRQLAPGRQAAWAASTAARASAAPESGTSVMVLPVAGSVTAKLAPLAAGVQARR
jgi:hypothetical protein